MASNIPAAAASRSASSPGRTRRVRVAIVGVDSHYLMAEPRHVLMQSLQLRIDRPPLRLGLARDAVHKAQPSWRPLRLPCRLDEHRAHTFKLP